MSSSVYQTLPHGHICASNSSSCRLLVYLFLFSGRSRSLTRKRSFNVFAKSIDPCKYVFIIPILPSIPRMSLRVLPIPPCFLALVFLFFLSFLLQYFCLEPLKLPGGHHLFLVSPYIMSNFLNYAIPPYSSSLFCCFLPAPSTMAGILFSGLFLTLYYHFDFLIYIFVLSGCIPSSALNTALLVVLEHLRLCSAAVGGGERCTP